MRFVLTETATTRWTWRLFWRDEEVAHADHDYGSEALARDGARDFARELTAAELALRGC